MKFFPKIKFLKSEKTNRIHNKSINYNEWNQKFRLLKLKKNKYFIINSINDELFNKYLKNLSYKKDKFKKSNIAYKSYSPKKIVSKVKKSIIINNLDKSLNINKYKIKPKVYNKLPIIKYKIPTIKGIIKYEDCEENTILERSKSKIIKKIINKKIGALKNYSKFNKKVMINYITIKEIFSN